MTTHPHLEGLISIGENLCLLEVEVRNGANAKSIGSLDDDDLAGLKRALGRLADRLSSIQDDVRTLHTALAALPGGGVDEAEECHRHSCKRKAVLRQPRLIGWRLADYTMETNDQKVALNWQGNIEVLPIFEGDPNTALPTPTPHEADRNG